jgi:hypothetical protein
MKLCREAGRRDRGEVDSRVHSLSISVPHVNNERLNKGDNKNPLISRICFLISVLCESIKWIDDDHDD